MVPSVFKLILIFIIQPISWSNCLIYLEVVPTGYLKKIAYIMVGNLKLSVKLSTQYQGFDQTLRQLGLNEQLLYELL